MGTDYTAKLYYGFEISDLPGTFFDDEDSEYPSPFLMNIGVEEIFFFDTHRYAIVLPETYRVAGYSDVQFDLPVIDTLSLARFKKACEELHIPYQEPRWNLVVSVW